MISGRNTHIEATLNINEVEPVAAVVLQRLKLLKLLVLQRLK